MEILLKILAQVIVGISVMTLFGLDGWVKYLVFLPLWVGGWLLYTHLLTP